MQLFVSFGGDEARSLHANRPTARRNMLLDDVGGVGMSHVWPRAASHIKAALLMP